MFKTLAGLVPRDSDLPDRALTIDTRTRVLMGTLYDLLGYDFQDEQNGAGEYIPLRQRAPSVRYGLCKLVVDESISMLFGEGRFPAVDCEDQAVKDAMGLVEQECGLVRAMREAALYGSCGSVAILMRVLSKRPYFSVMRTTYLTPTWRDDAPDTLASVTERYKVKGAVLRSMGYPIPKDDDAADYWFQRVWDSQAENWFQPLRVSDWKDEKPFVRDDSRSVTHALGFVPIVWIRNLPGGDAVDGDCTFRPAIETSIEIDYLLSQGGRGLKYASDPKLVVVDPGGIDSNLGGGASNALVLGEKGDAKLLEIDGSAAAAVIEYVRALREMALESVHGNRANADKLSAAQSGRAMELMHQALINLVDQLRDAYGTNGLLPLLRMVVAASARFPMVLAETPIPTLNPKQRITLRWPPYFAPTLTDKQTEAVALTTLRTGGLLSQEAGVNQTCETWDIGDAKAEMTKIKADEAAQDARLAAQAAMTQAKETVEA